MAAHPTTIVAYGQTGVQKGSNLGLSTLANGISAAATLVSVADAMQYTAWPADNFVVRIGNELLYVTSRSGNDLTIGARGFGGTTAVSHLAGDVVRVTPAAELFASVIAEIQALEGWVGVNAARAASITGATTLGTTHGIVAASASGGAFALTLPACASNAGKMFLIVKTEATANVVTLTPNGSDTIGGQATYPMLGLNRAVLLFSFGGTNWLVLDEKGLIKFDSSGGNYTVALKDHQQFLRFTATLTVTLPTTGLPAGFVFIAFNDSTGTITFSGGTLKAKGSKLASQYGGASWFWDGSNWIGMGDLST